MNEQETIVDIAAEKRRLAEHIRNNLSTVPVRQWDQQAEIKSLEDEANRPEAAYKRERGDCAKMREALKRIVAASIVAKNTNAPEWILQRIADIFAMATTALAATPRNCDVGTPEEQAERYLNFTDRYNPCSYKGHARCAEDCPVHTKLAQVGYGDLLCQLEWAQMPYEEGGDK